MNISPHSHVPEFSHPFAIEKISATGMTKTLEANADERARLTKRFELLELKSLTAELNINLTRARQAFAVTGRLVADVVQECVVTLEPVPAHIESAIEMLYSIEEKGMDLQAEIKPDEVEVEPITDGAIDLGELVAQSLGIALDPYPRKPGVAFQEPLPDVQPSGPLAKLAELKKKKD